MINAFDLYSDNKSPENEAKLSGKRVNLPPAGKSEIYEGDLDNSLPIFNPVNRHFADVDIIDFQIRPKIRTKKQIEKQLVKEKLIGIYELNSREATPYLEHNALTRGDLLDDLEYKINVVSQCQKSVVWFQGESSGMNYVRKIECRKMWCPDCGGKGGFIHKNRLHSILNRFDVDKYNIRQLVLTVPESLREYLQNRNNLNNLIKAGKQLTEKFFGSPVFDKKGHVKKYKLEKGCIFYLHMFGDEDRGVFKPHLNIHILEEKSEKLKLSESIIETMKKYWLKKIKAIDESIQEVNIHYKFRITKPHKLHALKYMSRPWGVEDFEKCTDELKKFLVIEMSGFQYLRFWGALANCNYSDQFNVQEEKNICEEKCGEKLISLGVSFFDEESWKNRMIMIDKGFYLITRKEKWGREDENKKNRQAKYT